MRQAKALVALSLLVLCAALAPASSGAFGLTEIEVRSLDAEGHTQVEAGSHPDTFETSFQTETEEVPPGSGKLFPLGEPKDLAAPPPSFRQGMKASAQTQAPSA